MGNIQTHKQELEGAVRSQVSIVNPQSPILNLPFPTHPRRLMLDLARIEPALDRLHCAVQALAGPLDWSVFAELCHRNAVTGLVYAHLQNHSDLVPPEVLHRFEQQYQWNEALHVVHCNELLQLSSLFERRGIPYLLMRGIALVEEVYRDAGLRPYGDIDLFFDPETFPYARQVLDREGYQPRPDYANTFVRGGIVLDLHRNTFNCDRIGARRYLFNASSCELFDSSRTILVDGHPVRVLDHETSVILMALHLVKHAFSHHLWWVDLAEALGRFEAELDWEEIHERARRWGCLRAVDFVLRRVALDLQAPIPRPALQLIERRSSGWLERKVDRALTEQRALCEVSHLLLIGTIKGPRQKCAYIVEHLLPSRDVRRQIGRDSPTGFYTLDRLVKLGTALRNSLRFLG